ncbi:MAG: Bax inhibitor-1 family protein, partial [Streptococcaceae bacterium]|nr:Bax inhibitor-1 family protein [Streptococcaceae bacterium]
MENPQPIIDERQSGLSAFFAKIYGLVGVGILISALVSFITIKFFPQNLVSIMQGGNVMVFIIFLIPLLIVFPAQRAAAKNSPTALPLFILYSAVLGFILSFSLIFYTGTDITMAFLISAGMFFGMSVYGRFTKRNLSGMAKAMIAGVWGLIILGFLNMLFFHSTPLMLLGSVLGIVI